MSTAIHNVHLHHVHVICDKCNDLGPKAATTALSRLEAKAIGWVHKTLFNGWAWIEWDHCPTCAHHLEKTDPLDTELQ